MPSKKTPSTAAAEKPAQKTVKAKKEGVAG